MSIESSGGPWEEIDSGDPRVRRLPVPGGWLYQVERRELRDTISPGVGITRAEHVVGWHDPLFVQNTEAALAAVHSVISGAL